MANTKATKKFQQRHLKDVLKQRQEFKKVKQKQILRQKRRAQDREDDGEDRQKPKEDVKGKALKDMSVDEFFQTGFEVPERPTKKRKRPIPDTELSSKKTVRETAQNDESQDGEEQIDDSDESILEGGGVVEASQLADSASDNDLEDDDAHKKTLESLSRNDPEFYKYLKENDAELLDFEDNDLADLDLAGKDDPDDVSDEDDEEPQAKRSQDTLSLEALRKWEHSLIENKSLRTAREVVLAFRAAVHLNESTGKTYKYAITTSDVYNKIVVMALNQIPELLQHHVPVKENASRRISIAHDSKAFRQVAPMVKSHVVSVLHLLTNLSDGVTLRLTLKSILALLPYALPYRKVVKELGKGAITIWSDASSDEATKIAAFLILRRLMVIGDAGVREAILKATYQGLVRGCRNTTVHTLQGINLMKNSAAELWGLDPSTGYTTGFGFIRQLAVHLRSTITNKTKDSYKVVYNWQCVHSLDFWSRVLAQNCSTTLEAESGKESLLRPLIYPTVQVTLGVMRLIPTSQYFPLRFQLFRSLLRISLSTNTYIPLAPLLYEVLQSAEMRKPPKASTLKALDFSTSIRAAKTFLRTRVYQEGVGEQVAELLGEFFVLWCKSIAFPELALPVTVMLKRWLKEVNDKSKGNRNHKINSAIALVVQKLDANARWIEQRRAKVDYAPSNRSQVDKFLSDVDWKVTPLGAFVATQRKLKEQRDKLLLNARKQDKKRRDVEEDEDEEDEELLAGPGDDIEEEEEEEDDDDAMSENGE